jgi:hypothetical protein
MAYVYTNTDRHLLYCSTELGEAASISTDGTTLSSKLARNGAPVQTAVSKATAKLHIASVDKGVVIRD